MVRDRAKINNVIKDIMYGLLISIIMDWNDLPNEWIPCDSVLSFKSRLKRYCARSVQNVLC